MGEIRCELSWSPSRAKTFESCRRQYFYQYYGSWRGWERSASPRARALYRLKQMKSLDVFVGIVVHDVIEHWFHEKRAGRELGASDLEARARERFDRAWRESRGTGWLRDPKRCARFVEHHYGVGVDPEKAAAVWKKASASLQAFFAMPELEPIRRSDPGSWRAVESLDTFEIAGTKVYAVPDFAFEHEGRTWIVDWKTGKPRAEDQRQVQVYALYAQDRWEVDPEQLRLLLVYLPASAAEEVAVDPDELRELRKDVAHGIELLADLHYDPDTTKPDPARFPPNGAPRACGYCVFQEACEAAPREAREAGRAAASPR